MRSPVYAVGATHGFLFLEFKADASLEGKTEIILIQIRLVSQVERSDMTMKCKKVTINTYIIIPENGLFLRQFKEILR